VSAHGNHLQHFINGHQTVDVIDDCESKRAMSGVLALSFTPAPDDRAVPESAIKNLFGRNVIE